MTRRTDTELDPPTPTAQRAVPRPGVATPSTPTPPWRREPAQPGRRDEQPSDMAVTTRLERMSVELTPPPLPPSPATADAERYFEQVPTNPGAVTRRDPSAVGETRTVAGTIRVPPPPMAQPRPWVLPVLVIATALAVGMVLGALLFGRRGAAPAECPPCATAPRVPGSSTAPGR
jgi:hypothetical protein